MSLDKNIEELVEKYFNGETSLVEEEQLQKFFEGEDIPVNLKGYQQQFLDLKMSKGTRWENFSEEKLFGKLERQVQEKTTGKVVSMKPSNNQVWFYRIAAAVALMLVGYFVGNGFKPNSEVAGLRAELEEVKNLMFDQINSTSASGRLQAVNNTLTLKEADDEILDALISRMNDDKNINVRLKAVESLARFGSQDKAKKALVEALGTIEAPAIQIALINVLVELKEKTAIAQFEKITERGSNLKEVRDEAHLGIFRLKDL